MATGSEKGILLDDSNNDTFKVKGGIFSNSTINLESNKADLENIATNSYAYALNGCVLGPAQVTVATGSVKDCNYSNNSLSATDRRGMDSGTVTGHGLSFDAPAGPGPLQTPPACTAIGVYHFDPGLYTNATRLNTYTDNNTCKGSVVHRSARDVLLQFHDWHYLDHQQGIPDRRHCHHCIGDVPCYQLWTEPASNPDRARPPRAPE